MEENLVGYLCNALDEDTQQAVEDFLQKNPEAQRRLEVLRKALEPLAGDQEPPEPPPGLVVRTLARVAEHSCSKLPPAPAIAGKVAPQRRRWWRADALVAAALLIAILGVVLSGLYTARDYQARTACAKNLNEFHQALVNYSLNHDKRFPSVADQDHPYNVAGIVVPVLAAGAGQMPSIRCPANGSARGPTMTMEQLRDLDPEDFARQAPHLSGCYAYTLGYQDETGRYHGLSQDSDGNLPLMGDRPADGRHEGNSPNHGGRGQNILHVNGKVDFYRHRATAAGDDVYLNHRRRVAAGVDDRDAVLGSSGDRP